MMQLLEIEQRLSGEERELAFSEYDAVLEALDKRLAEAMRIGVHPDEYARLERMREANLTARKILRLAVIENEE